MTADELAVAVRSAEPRLPRRAYWHAAGLRGPAFRCRSTRCGRLISTEEFGNIIVKTRRQDFFPQSHTAVRSRTNYGVPNPPAASRATPNIRRDSESAIDGQRRPPALNQFGSSPTRHNRGYHRDGLGQPATPAAADGRTINPTTAHRWAPTTAGGRSDDRGDPGGEFAGRGGTTVRIRRRRHHQRRGLPRSIAAINNTLGPVATARPRPAAPPAGGGRAAGDRHRSLRDVRDVELGDQNYSHRLHLRWPPAWASAVFQLPGTNALEIRERTLPCKMKELNTKLPGRGLKERDLAYSHKSHENKSVHPNAARKRWCWSA